MSAHEIACEPPVLEQVDVIAQRDQGTEHVRGDEHCATTLSKALDDGLSQIKNVPLLTCSGATGKGLDTLMQVAFTTRDRWSRRVPTSALNRWFEAALARNPPPAPGGVRIKLRYATQVAARPPTFVVFGNRTDSLPASYQRYLTNSLVADLDFGGLPIRLSFRGGRNPYKKD